jgi:molecular chaperone GrpE (heat shock protein)
MPFADYEDFDACVADNSDKRDPEAYCAEIKRTIEGADLSDAEQKALEESDCPEGHVSINGECVPVEEVEDVPPSSLDMSAPRVMAAGEGLDTEPIEREELSDGRVRYANLKLVDSGVWTDQNSQTPTLYDERTFENTEPKYNGDHDGPPVNIAHDIHKDGPNRNEPHEASVAGHIDPDSLRTDGEALYGDLVLNTDDSAGAFADDNLRSALENDGTAGFSPSVELMPTELRNATGSHAEEHVAAAELTGLGLVRDPASKSVDLRHETQNRAVAMAASDQSDKARVYERMLMSPDELREILDNYGLEGLDEMSDDDVMEVASDLHEDLMGELAPDEEGEEPEMGDYEDDEDEEDDEMEMADEGAIDVLEEQIDDLWDAIDEMKSEMATGEELSAEVEDAKAELAAAETVQELEDAKEELDKRLSRIEDEPAESKTLADAEGSDLDYSNADGGVDYDPATGSMSGR